uniref:Uncharacterized protein n=1 Tax=Knipowitschia caucasica TaxID=637954 RepID=A0AAV2KT07_KNICA
MKERRPSLMARQGNMRGDEGEDEAGRRGVVAGAGRQGRSPLYPRTDQPPLATLPSATLAELETGVLRRAGVRSEGGDSAFVVHMSETDRNGAATEDCRQDMIGEGQDGGGI